MSNILVTGCAGTTGTALVEFLMREDPDSKIIGVDNFYKNGSRDNLKHLNEINNGNFSFYEFDIAHASFYGLLDTYYFSHDMIFDEVYNLAAIVETPEFYNNPYGTFRVNCQGAIDLFNYCCQHGTERFVNASSSEIYGRLDMFETLVRGAESHGIVVKEDTENLYDSPEISTRWSYAHGKILTEYVMNDLAARFDHKTKVCHLRYANVYGENDLSPVHVIPYIVLSILTGNPVKLSSFAKTTKRTFLHNDDSTLGTYLAMKNMVSGHAYNIASSEEVTIFDLAMMCYDLVEEATCEHFSRQIDLCVKRKGDPKRRLLSTERAADELNFKTTVSLEEGINRIINKMLEKGLVWQQQLYSQQEKALDLGQ